MREDLTRKRLMEVLDYNPETGVFTRLVGKGAGQPVAGSQVGRYSQHRIDGTRYQAHVLAWLYVYGEYPRSEIDHENRNKSDNRIANLRCATRSLNMGNITEPRHNTSGVKGVCFDNANGRWMAYINIHKKFKNLGRYGTIAEAQSAYNKAARDHFGEFATLSPPVTLDTSPGSFHATRQENSSAIIEPAPRKWPSLRDIERPPCLEAYPF